MSVVSAQPSPSTARRNGLKQGEKEQGGSGVPLVSNFFPIERYYNAAEKLYEAFGAAFDEHRLDDAYIFGLRFAEFSVEGLPKHDYYRGTRHEAQRRRNTLQVKEVLSKVEQVVVMMDEEELAKHKEMQKRHDEAMRRQQEALRREEEQERQRFDALQERISKMKGRPSSLAVVVSSESVESSAMSKLEMLRQPDMSPNRPHTDSERRKDRSISSSHRDDGRSSSRRGSGPDEDRSSIRRSASGSSDDNSTSRDSHRRSRRSSVQNNGSFDDNNNNNNGSDSYKQNGHRRSTMLHSPTPSGRRSSGGSSDDDTANGHGNSSSRRTSSRLPPTSHRVSGSERSSTTMRNSSSSGSTHSNGSRVRNKSPTLLNDSDQIPPSSLLPPKSNSWSQAPDPKDAWKLEQDDAEPVSSRFHETFPANRRGSTSTNGGSHMPVMPSAPPAPKTNTLPPPMLPPPPSYNQVISTLKSDPASIPTAAINARYRTNQYFGPGGTGLSPDFTMNNSINRPFAAPAGGAKRVTMQESSVVLPSRRSSVNGYSDTSVVTPATQPVRPVKPVERIPIRKLRDAFANDYRRAQQEGWIEIRPLDTYQGRLRQSTNGCTVISPLVVAHHLRNSAGGVLDAEIVDVIDKECGPLLREIRSKLGLEGDSLIIPSDVHDHLVDRKILQQNKFYGATGGNIMDRDHLMEFLKLLQAEDKGTYHKAGACLFFHEHVVSLVKMPVGRGKVVYDLVDSMPSSNHGGRATRTRCRDLAALEILLRWYSSRKFSESECSYIDRNDWDENMADFDPRVFQSFVWTE